MPQLPDTPLGFEEGERELEGFAGSSYSDRDDFAEPDDGAFPFLEQLPIAGKNITLDAIACTLRSEGTERAFSYFFLSKTNNYAPLLEIDLGDWKEVIEAHADRFMWGTDRGGIVIWAWDLEVGLRLTDYARAFIGQLDPDVQELFAYRNAERLLSNTAD